MVSKQKKRGQNKWRFSRLDETLGNGITVNTMGNEALELQANAHHEDFERIVDTACLSQVTGSNTDNKIRNAVDSAVIAVENCMDDTILTARTMW